MPYSAESKIQELNGALAALGLHLSRLSDSVFGLRRNSTELKVDVAFSGGVSGTYNVRAEVLESGIGVIVRWIEAQAKWLIIGTQQYLNSIQGSLTTSSWTEGRRHWSAKINQKTRPFLFDTAGAARQLQHFVASDLSKAAPQPTGGRSSSLHGNAEHSRPGASPGSISSRVERTSVYACDACIHAPSVDEVLKEAVPVPSFGDPTKAEVLTIGINPSVTEFYHVTKNHQIASAKHPDARLPMVRDYGVASRLDLNVTQIGDIRSKQESYFQRPKPHPWFSNWRALLETVSASWSGYASKVLQKWLRP
jgi:hypothetical protein